MLVKREDAVLVAIDLQPSFLKPIEGAARVLDRATFLVEIANLLGIPVLATEQNPTRIGGTDEAFATHLQAGCSPIAKMSFGCGGSADFLERLSNLGARQVVLAGVETHICVNQTAHQLLEQGLQVFIAGDAVDARTSDMHRIGLGRLRSAGAVIAHSESIAYEWLGTADNPAFREALAIVKRHPAA